MNEFMAGVFIGYIIGVLVCMFINHNAIKSAEIDYKRVRDEILSTLRK